MLLSKGKAKLSCLIRERRLSHSKTVTIFTSFEGPLDCTTTVPKLEGFSKLVICYLSIKTVLSNELFKDVNLMGLKVRRTTIRLL